MNFLERLFGRKPQSPVRGDPPVNREPSPPPWTLTADQKRILEMALKTSLDELLSKDKYPEGLLDFIPMAGRISEPTTAIGGKVIQPLPVTVGFLELGKPKPFGCYDIYLVLLLGDGRETIPLKLSDFVTEANISDWTGELRKAWYKNLRTTGTTRHIARISDFRPDRPG